MTIPYNVVNGNRPTCVLFVNAFREYSRPLSLYFILFITSLLYWNYFSQNRLLSREQK